MKKKLLSTGVITTCLLSMAISAFAHCEKIDTTYNLTRGLTSRNFETGKNPTFDVCISPKIGIKEVNLDMYLRRKMKFGWGEVDSNSVSSIQGGKVVLKGNKDGTYNILLRNESGSRIKGDMKITVRY